MAVAAEATSTLRIGCRVFCVDYHLPVVLIKSAMTIDRLSGGRLELGLGAGWQRVQRWVPRWATTILTICRPHERHSRPARP